MSEVISLLAAYRSGLYCDEVEMFEEASVLAFHKAQGNWCMQLYRVVQREEETIEQYTRINIFCRLIILEQFNSIIYSKKSWNYQHTTRRLTLQQLCMPG